jgi:putative spermidine/putrescine transport system permease protein
MMLRSSCRDRERARLLQLPGPGASRRHPCRHDHRPQRVVDPVAFLVIAAALKGFDRNLERAAMSAGAGPLRTFFFVTLPVLRPAILIGALFAFLHSFNEAVVAIFIAGRDASTLPKKMFEAIRLESDPVIAVVSTLLTGAVLLGVLIC